MRNKTVLLVGFMAWLYLGPLAWAMDQSPITGPVLGYFFDEVGGGLRAINGIPGASTIGALLDLEVKLSKAEISPTGNFAIAVEAEKLLPVLIRLGTGPVEVQAMEAFSPGADRIVISPSGSSAALYNQKLQVIEVVFGLPSAPYLRERLSVLDLTSPLGPIAVSDHAGVVLVAAQEAAGDAVYAFQSCPDFRSLAPPLQSRKTLVQKKRRDVPYAVPWDSGFSEFYFFWDPTRLLNRNVPNVPVFMGTIGRVSSIAFIPQTADALIADIENNQVVLLRDAEGAASILVLADKDQGTSKPVAVAMDENSNRIYIANSESRTVTTLDEEGHSMGSFYSHTAPAMLQRLGGQSVYRITDPGELPMLIMDGRSKAPQIYFVPFTLPEYEERDETAQSDLAD